LGWGKTSLFFPLTGPQRGGETSFERWGFLGAPPFGWGGSPLGVQGKARVKQVGGKRRARVNLETPLWGKIRGEFHRQFICFLFQPPTGKGGSRNESHQRTGHRAARQEGQREGEAEDQESRQTVTELQHERQTPETQHVDENQATTQETQ